MREWWHNVWSARPSWKPAVRVLLRRRGDMKLAITTLTFLLTALPAAAGQWWAFDERRYYDALIAGVREPHLSAFLAAGTKMEFQVKDDDPRLAADIDVGGELPIVGWEQQDSVGGRMPKKKLGVGLWIPIDFHMIQDLRDRSVPIVNNDYRYGLMLKAQYGLTPTQWLSGRLHIGHESTHLGDEFSIVGERAFHRTFERINVSWEYLDAGLLYERAAGETFYAIRGGVTANLRGSYYSTDVDSITVSARGPVIPSHNRKDCYVGAEVTWIEAIGTWDVYASAEARWRSVYDYHRPTRDTPEDRQASINLIVGTKISGSNKASPFVRVYRGVNPHGQFRNQRNYTEVGIGVRLVR
jgi:hypothetical protein